MPNVPALSRNVLATRSSLASFLASTKEPGSLRLARPFTVPVCDSTVRLAAPPETLRRWPDGIMPPDDRALLDVPPFAADLYGLRFLGLLTDPGTLPADAAAFLVVPFAATFRAAPAFDALPPDFAFDRCLVPPTLRNWVRVLGLMGCLAVACRLRHSPS